jgi:tetratricopeptide (TPR) repeat protein
LQYEWKWQEAESQLKTALALDSNDVEARIQYATQFRLQGRIAESKRQFQIAGEEDPASAVVASHLAYEWYLSGQLDSALAESARAQQFDSSNLTTVQLGALVLLGAGRVQEAHHLILRAAPRNPLVLYVLAATGDRATALERLRAVESTRPPPPLLHTARAFAMLGLRDTAQALDALERATDAGEIWFWGSGSPSGPLLAGIRKSARFQALLTRVGLSQ